MVVVSERAWGLSSQCRPTLAPSRLSAEDVVSRSEKIFQDAIPTGHSGHATTIFASEASHV